MKNISSAKNMKILAIFLFIQFVLVSSVGCTITHKFGPYYGKVIDAETKEPIEGAAVLVVFYTEQISPAGSVTHYADALETVTDKKGEFRFTVHRITAFKPLHTWDPYGYFTIFKPGYGHYPDSKGVKPIFVPNGMLPANEYVTVEMPSLKTREERVKMPSLNFDIPYEKQERLIEMLNQEMKKLGASGKYSKESFDRR